MKKSEVSLGYEELGYGKAIFVELQVDFHSFVYKLVQEFLRDGE